MSEKQPRQKKHRSQRLANFFQRSGEWIWHLTHAKEQRLPQWYSDGVTQREAREHIKARWTDDRNRGSVYPNDDIVLPNLDGNFREDLESQAVGKRIRRASHHRPRRSGAARRTGRT